VSDLAPAHPIVYPEAPIEPPPVEEPPVSTACIRKAWLELGSLRLDLESKEGGWACTSLDLGWPAVREVTDNRPDADGIDDRTRYFGSRAITADIVTLPHAESIDAIATQFGRFMSPRLRAELHYVLDRPGQPERVLRVRGNGYGWPIEGGTKRNVQLSWIAADPIARSVEEDTVTAWCGSDAPGGGRTYDLIHDRVYGEGGGSRIDAFPVVEGDVSVLPHFRIYGPATAPRLEVWHTHEGVELTHHAFAFREGFILGDGEYVDVDSSAHTATFNGESVLGSVQWMVSNWLEFTPEPFGNRLALFATSTNYLTQVVATWREGWLA
jgi:hypothetical protein